MDTFYKCMVVIKITIDLIPIGYLIHDKYNQYKNYKKYINENLHLGECSELLNHKWYEEDDIL